MSLLSVPEPVSVPFRDFACSYTALLCARGVPRGFRVFRVFRRFRPVRLRGLSGKDDNSFQHFKSVAIDGAVLSEDSSALIQKDYKAEEGSTVITLHKKMLNRLSAGKHTVTITFDDGSVSTGLTILVPPGGYSPTTGDSSRIGFWAALMVLAGLGFAGADYARRKLRRPRYVGKH